MVRKVLESAIANAEHNDGADIDELKVSAILCGSGSCHEKNACPCKGTWQSYFKAYQSHYCDCC